VTVGDLYWVELPLRGGRAQAGRRPAIILQTITDRLGNMSERVLEEVFSTLDSLTGRT
jgi:mRNA-degrading endonuclease toxin of MazEF toxin-antitoxin module